MSDVSEDNIERDTGEKQALERMAGKVKRMDESEFNLSMTLDHMVSHADKLVERRKSNDRKIEYIKSKLSEL